MMSAMFSRLKVGILVFAVLVSSCAGAGAESAKKVKYEPNYESLSQWQVPQWFEDAVLGIYCHWGVYSVPGFAFTDPSERVDSGLWYGAQMYNPENVFGVYQHHLKTYGDPAEFGYKDFVPMFTAEKWDPDAWAEFFKSVGTDFAGLAFEHGDGFCLWDTEHDAFNAADMGPKRDIAGDLFRAARKQGMRTVATFHKGPGSIYSAHGRKYCPPGVDVNNEKYADLYGPSTRDELYNKLIEVIDKYRPDQLWFEGSGMYGERRWKLFLAYYFNAAEDWGKDVVVTQKSTDEVLLSCSALDIEGGIFPRGVWHWAGMEEPQEQRWQKDVPIGNYWAYAEGVGCRPVNMLVDGIVDRISKNGVTLLDIAPKADGTLPQAQIDGLKKLGEWMAVNRESLYAARCAPFNEGGVDTWAAGTIRFTEKGPYLYAIELGNDWPPTVGFADYEDSKKPTAPYTLAGVKPVKNSEIIMLGSEKSLPWHQDGDDLVIEELPEPLPCEHAWSFKIKVAPNIVLAKEEIDSSPRQFKAKGPTKPVKLPSRQKGAVKVTFDLLPTSMSFDLPAFPCMVTENGIKYSNFWAETYDPRNWSGEGGLASFEPLMDRQNRYARMWIEHQSDARIVVRVRGALCNREEGIAHTDFPSESPYGPGDWVDEWFIIYPDGVNLRHVRIYTGLAPRSRPFGIDRDPPKVVHEFMEAAVIGDRGTVPTDLIETNALTLVRLIGDHVNRYLANGKSATICYDPYPKGFGDFRDANIMLVNLKSQYKPFTIAMPYGCRVNPYMAEGALPHIFQTWGNTSALGHMVNYWHYRRTDNTLEQIYLQGMTNADNPVDELVSLAWSWIANPRLWMKSEPRKFSYDIRYDHAQRAYIIPREGQGPCELEFTLEEDLDIGEFGAAMWIVNPCFIVEDWGTSGVELQVDGKDIEVGKNFRIGYEKTRTGTNLVLWLKVKSDKMMSFAIKPKD